MIGKEFGSLTVVSEFGQGPRGISWLCKCKCGNKIKFSTSALVLGRQSCGCSITRSGKTIPISKHIRKQYESTIACWKGMLARCHYTLEEDKQNCYKGIEICNDWFDFEVFLRDMGPRPSLEHSIDRIDSTGNYYKENCRWLLKVENSSRAVKGKRLSPERIQRQSEGLKKAYAEGRARTSDETKKRISEGAVKRIGRKLQTCISCGGNSYMPLCQKCSNRLR